VASHFPKLDNKLSVGNVGRDLRHARHPHGPALLHFAWQEPALAFICHALPAPMVTSGWERARIPRVVRPWLDLRSGWDVRVGSARVGSTCMCHCGGCSIRYKGHDQRNCYSGHHDPIEGRIAFRWRPVFLLFVSCWQLLVQQTALCAHLAAFVD
jgi:hypothetical protein